MAREHSKPHSALVEKLADQPFALIGFNSVKDLERLAVRREEERITWRSFSNGPLGNNAIEAGLPENDVVLPVDGKDDFESGDHFHS